MQVITWDMRKSAKLPPGWNPEPFRLKDGRTVACPFDGRQPYIVRPHCVSMSDNVIWARKLSDDYRAFADSDGRQGAFPVRH